MNQKWKTVLISVLTPSGIMSGIALTVLWGYFSRLDRLDVFFEVMSIKSIFVLVFLAAMLSLALLLFIFFVISLFIPVIIPQDMNNLPAYDKIQNNLLTVLMISGILPVIFIYIFYYVLHVSQKVKDYSGWISMISIALMAIIISALMTRKHLERDLSFKNRTIKWTRRGQIYLLIPMCIAFLAHLQVFPLEIVFRNINAPDEKVNFWTLTGLAFICYMLYFVSLLPGLVYLRMDAKSNLQKKISTSLIASLMVLFLISTKITVVPVIFTHAVIKFSGISDFTAHSYIIKSDEYPEEFFSNPIWEQKEIKPGKYYKIQAVSMFTTNRFNLLCPVEIIEAYRASWKFNPWDTEFDSDVRRKLQEKASYCVPVSASALKRWDVPL
ncbi:hypothetical protein [Vibrio parahaemolyticus]|uniref:hypothetical protein n=1 Tax=Vibrio parahaemolyticus TaxID=670 RepID=UPI00227C668A|nr:hypothetical protein [Vibrio parahaemolyticus]WAG36309.1 hypothetical protein JK088_24670 [Vibrio parahaemolyticus]